MINALENVLGVKHVLLFVYAKAFKAHKFVAVDIYKLSNRVLVTSPRVSNSSIVCGHNRRVYHRHLGEIFVKSQVARE